MRDFVAAGTRLAGASAGYAILFNILHAELPVALLQKAFRVLAPDGKTGVIHWTYNALNVTTSSCSSVPSTLRQNCGRVSALLPRHCFLTSRNELSRSGTNRLERF